MSKEGSVEKGGILAVFVILGLMAYPLAAQMWHPPLEPARTIMYLQALWNDGMYGVVITFFTTFMVIISAVASPILLVSGLRNLVSSRSKNHDPSFTLPTGSSLTWRGGNNLAWGASGLGALLASSSFSYVALTTPIKLSFLGSFGGFALFFAAFAPILGIPLFLDAILPTRWLQGRIVSLAPGKLSDGTPSSSYDLVVGESKHSISPDLAAKLKVEDKIAVRTTAILDRMLELRR